MEYSIKLSGTPFDDGAIDLDRLESLSLHLYSIAKGALQMRMFGTSVKKGRDTDEIANALKIRLRGLKEGSTVLQLECRPFRETLSGVQGNLFHQEIIRRLPEQTPVGLVMESFQAALDPDNSGEMLDGPLIREMQKFKNVFVNETQNLSISNNGSLPDIQLNIQSLKKLKSIEDRIPNPQVVIISGVVEELKFSKAKVTFIPERGRPFVGFLSENVPHIVMANLWGKKATIYGTSHFKANGQMAFVEISKVTLANSGDAYFSRTPKKETVQQQLERQVAQKMGLGNPLKYYAGLLSDAEGTLEEDLKILGE